ncbi:hypothetical protein [Staphylococcus gallinarum]|uniref:hypothetical protein n=1 Tax=Staphylococcus gallinarum TaxID=1293 RepID=UPI001E395862|nr:hypothetical protein [Staphylococcus gallinarum]MCD8845204.1 hypothetical protein [Staphylococcus gallinarum]
MKEKFGVSVLVLSIIYTLYILYKASLPSIDKTIQIIQERFNGSNILDPILIWVFSTMFIGLSVTALQLILPEREFGVISYLRRSSVTFAALYMIYIGPIVLFLLLLLFNASIVHITLVISVISFIGITFNKGKDLYIKMYNKIKKEY